MVMSGKVSWMAKDALIRGLVVVVILATDVRTSTRSHETFCALVVKGADRLMLEDINLRSPKLLLTLILVIVLVKGVSHALLLWL